MLDDPLEALAGLLGKTGGKATIEVTTPTKDLLQTSEKKATSCGTLTIAVHIDQGGVPGCQGGPFLIKLGNPAEKIGPSTREGGTWSLSRTPGAPTK